MDWQIVTVDGKPIGKAPKQDSVRTIALDSHTLQELRDHRDRMDEARKKAADAGLPWPEHGSVFVREGGAPINPDYLTDRFDLPEPNSGRSGCGFIPARCDSMGAAAGRINGCR
ncbi:hypothetical protein [Kitasatospora sp. NPDC050543]|uniref:hypothetical protein n=1 Tax=Kitasatospora sp. NPDC050543 TaxID=3364054 RepID=UPI0037B89D7F